MSTNRIYYDFEFIEDGYTIEPISLGMYRNDGAMLYLVNNSPVTMQRAISIPWLYEHVVTQLPYTLDIDRNLHMIRPIPNREHPDFTALVNLSDMAVMAEEFILSTPDVELWADYAAYDHVTLCQLFGPMIELPDGIPMFTHEFQQKVRYSGVDMSQCPSYEDPRGRIEHHAMYDAAELAHRDHWIDACLAAA